MVRCRLMTTRNLLRDDSKCGETVYIYIYTCIGGAQCIARLEPEHS